MTSCIPSCSTTKTKQQKITHTHTPHSQHPAPCHRFETREIPVGPNFPGADMVRSTLIRRPSHIPPPLPPSGRYHSPPRGVCVILTIHHKPSAHCGRIAVHWTVQSRVPSRLLSVRGGVQLTLTPPNTSRQRDTRERQKKKIVEKRERRERGEDCT